MGLPTKPSPNATPQQTRPVLSNLTLDRHQYSFSPLGGPSNKETESRFFWQRQRRAMTQEVIEVLDVLGPPAKQQKTGGDQPAPGQHETFKESRSPLKNDSLLSHVFVIPDSYRYVASVSRRCVGQCAGRTVRRGN